MQFYICSCFPIIIYKNNMPLIWKHMLSMQKTWRTCMQNIKIPKSPMIMDIFPITFKKRVLRVPTKKRKETVQTSKQQVKRTE